MKRIAVFIVVEHLRTGGAEATVVQLACQFDRALFRPTVVTFLDGELEDTVRQSGVELIAIRSGSRIGRLRALIRLFRQRKPDIIHTHMFSAGFWGRLAGIWLPTAIVVHSHHTLTFRQRSWKRYLPEQLLMPVTDRVICVSDAVKTHLTEAWRLSGTKMTVIRNGVDTQRFTTSRACFHEPPRLVAVGRLAPVKGFDVLLKAVAVLRESNVVVRCIIVGGGAEMQRLRDLRHELALDDRMEFAGLRHDVAGVLRESDVFVTSSFREGLSLALLEAMASGLPIVATRVGGNTELLDGVGLLVEPGDEQMLAEAISELLRDPEAALELGRKARARVVEHYSIGNTVRSHEHLLLDLIQQRTARRHVIKPSRPVGRSNAKR